MTEAIRMIPARQFLMERNLANSSRSPDRAQGTQTDDKGQGAFTEVEEQASASDLSHHERTHQPADERHVTIMVEDEFPMPDVFEQWVVL